ncbi:histone acetyltransferase [Sporothrix schenckii 1099-18]|uniref:Histone acetyltransferase n=1 Tax=Sporothrix schenckii 1099-18 TaxID=1397361 RepID=A0A0F2LR41_SPOSC|nr:histone acetyltransferase [Sporothrix schenckii 1099-18]KJR80003.1 histone acetyltransferase [Sporothrix schenckii 1099-18]
MALSKRKQLHDDDESRSAASAVQSAKTRRVTRHSIVPPPLPVPPKDMPQRRALRGNTGAGPTADNITDAKTHQGTRRTRRTPTTAKEQPEEHFDEQEAEDEESNGEISDVNDHPGTILKRHTRGRAGRMTGQSESAERPRQLRGGKTLPPQPGSTGRPSVRPQINGRASTAARPAATKRNTRQAVKGSEIADSDGDTNADEGEPEDDEAEAKEDNNEELEDDDDDEEIDDTEDELAGPATIIPPRTKTSAPPVPQPAASGLKRTNVVPPAVTPVSPPKIPSARPMVAEVVPPSPPPLATAAVAMSPVPAPTIPKKETTIKPPVPLALASATTLAPPKTITEIKPPASPPAPRYLKATPIQPPHIPPSPTQVVPQPQKPKAVQQLREEGFARQQQQHQHLSRSPKQTIVTTATSNNATTAPRSATTPTSATSQAATSTVPPSSPSQPDRNIDKVVLGEICFKAWYPSYYGKEVLGDTAGNTHNGRGNHQTKGTGKENHVTSHHYQHSHHSHGHGHGHGGKDAPPMLDRLYVCPFCFKYSKEIVPWHGHVQVCDSQFQIPGEKVYVHPKGVRTIHVPVSSTTPKGKRKRVSSGVDVQYVEQVVKDEGEWSIWEVDGEKDVLFCQNLSLFAKLFLDNKSVFFDVTGFYYFLLVYTPPPSLPSSLRAAATATASPMSGANANGQASILGAAPRPRVVGFFSKEKMSWDNNNLACILVFPPWQRKGLGALLMGISYEISRREGILGGPEKPISDLGKKGYKRFWGSEIARWLLSVDITTATSSLSHPNVSSPSSSLDRQPTATAIPPPTIPPPYGPPAGAVTAATSAKDGANSTDNESLIIDIADCSRATWIVRDDCLYVLRDMGIVEDAGMGLPKEYCENVLANPDEPSQAVADDTDGLDSASSAGVTNGLSSASAGATAARVSNLVSSGTQASNGAVSGSAAGGAAAGGTLAGEKQVDAPKDVQRVRISKAAVRQWVKDHRINLDKACDPAGFIKIYTNKDESQQAPEEV